MKRKSTLLLSFCLALGVFVNPAALIAQELEKSAYHLFLDYDFAVTLEVVEDGKMVTPILNLIAFSGGTWEITPPDIRILNDKGAYASDIRFSIDTGDGSQPYVTTYLQINGGDYIGFDLVGDFRDYKEPKLARIRFGDEWFALDPVEEEAFEAFLNGLNLLDLRDPDLITAFEALDLPLMGSREVVDE